MENLDDTVEKEDSGLSTNAKNLLNQGAGWAKAVAVIGFVLAGLMVLGSIGMFLMLPVGGIIYLVVAAVYVYISYLLYTQAQAASAGNFDMDKFAENFAKFWKTTVIFMIVGFVLGIIMTLVMGSMSSGMRF